MQNAPSQNVDDSATASRLTSDPVASNWVPNENKFWIWMLLIAGILLVCFANSVGYLLAKKQMAPGFFTWNSDDVRTIAQIVRTAGIMVFTIGIVERLALAISKLKS